MGFVDDLRQGLRDIDWTIPYGPSLWRALRDWPAEKLAQWNMLVRWSAFPCDDLDWWVFVETALPALGEFVLVIVDFDWDDIARGYLRPVGLRSRFAAIENLGGRFRKRFELPEFGEWIGARLPGAKVVKRFVDHPATRLLFKFDAIAQKALFYWMILDVTTDFFYVWVSGLFRTEKCAQTGSGAGYSNDDYIATYVATNDRWGWYAWGGLMGRTWRTEPYVCNANFLDWGSPDQEVYVVGMRRFSVAYPPNASVRMDLRWWGDDGTVYDEVRDIPPMTYSTVVATIPAGRQARFYARFRSNVYPVRLRVGPTMVQGWGLGGA